MKLHPSNPLPLHVQLRNFIEKRIKIGDYQEKIPSERELMDQFEVSRATVREAVSNLVNDGILEKVHGKGTFIKQAPPVQDWINRINSFTETIRETGRIPGAKLLTNEVINAKEKPLTVFQEKRLYFIERLRYASNQPIAIEQHYYPPIIGQQLQVFDLNEAVIYDLLENELGIQFYETDELITCMSASPKEALLLEVAEGTSLLVMERVLYDQLGNRIEFLTSVYRPDLFTFRIRRHRF
ncbi:GntR family transcriptional regulator [Salipaludibacillus sp. CUR1]|uniref:GntR family transcriptional regulator n=1 Tax=Salipaludibacillus sp. CUR1 TaxID=2820003 RepID=UPI001E4552B9|nr:GntR family transcriptional regulator [Salipaludibacillus sp. CUR1]MCE7792848.1 GntR family transcriptional regulator [Salipaludibacillus sp. CUR1]